jgi:hypothetical protein
MEHIAFFFFNFDLCYVYVHLFLIMPVTSWRRPQAGSRGRGSLSLCETPCLQNAKRGGDVTHIRAEDLDRVEINEGYGELTVSVCRTTITAEKIVRQVNRWSEITY